MKEVAELAGVSQTTVSFVINQTAGMTIPEATRQRVMSAVSDLGYRPNAAAKTLRTSKSHSIGFVTDELASSPFAGDMVRGAQGAAWAREHVLMIVNTGGDPELERAAVEELLQRRVDGVIYASMAHRQVSPPPNLWEVPAVLLDCFTDDGHLPTVRPDEVGGGLAATEALLCAGHRRIGFINIGPERVRPASEGRLKGYREALSRFGVAFDPDIVRTGNANADDGYRFAKELLERPEPPTALFCGTDRMAMGAYDAVRDLGLAIPRDVSVVGFDDQQLISMYLRPALSTVALPFLEMGRLAAERVVDPREESEEAAASERIVECAYVERQSTAPPLS